jgi:membrane protease YdiL (CAAX protease family)
VLSRRAVLRREVLLVLGVSLGASAIWSVLNLINKLTMPAPLSKQTTALNESVVPDRPWLDLTYQLVRIFLSIVPALLAVHLLGRDSTAGRLPGHDLRGVDRLGVDRLGLDRRRLGVDLGVGVILAALIGVPGLALYLAARGLGINTVVSAANLPDTWWAVLVLVLAAAANGVQEEIIVVGYLLTRLREVGWRTWQAVALSAALRGSYHLYQGFGACIGNAIMGVVFALFFVRTRRVVPLIMAHTLLDVVAYLGYTVLRDRVSFL